MENKQKHEVDRQLVEVLINSRKSEVESKELSSNNNLTKAVFTSDIRKEQPVAVVVDGKATNPITTDVYSEKVCILIFLLSNFIFGFVGFHSKYVSKQYPESFNSNGFLFWRCMALLTGSYLLMKKNNTRLIKLQEVKNLSWFLIRVFGNYIGSMFYVLSMLEIRVGTVACISAMSPILVLIFSIIILKDKFYIRYIFGLIICFGGAFLIVSNDRKPILHISDELADPFDPLLTEIMTSETVVDSLKFVKGISFACVHLLFVSIVIIGMKIISVEKISSNEQCFYIGLFNGLVSLVACFIGPSFRIHLEPGFVLGSYFNGVVFLFGSFFYVEALKGVAINKLTPLSYMSTLTVFFLGVVVFGESIFMTDILGSSFIVAFNAYNTMVPLK
jgi:drug/metabolite transporter (DMT)-like permease